jgi:hypothetical protein
VARGSQMGAIASIAPVFSGSSEIWTVGLEAWVERSILSWRSWR